MDWSQFGIFIITFVGLFIWNRTEAREDIRHMDTKLESNRNLIMAIHIETRQLVQTMHNEIKEEMKDFHGRLCAIEEKNKR